MMILDLLDDLLLPFLQFANEQCTAAEEVTNIGLLITLDMTGTYLPLPVLSWLRHATVIDRYKQCQPVFFFLRSSHSFIT